MRVHSKSRSLDKPWEAFTYIEDLPYDMVLLIDDTYRDHVISEEAYACMLEECENYVDEIIKLEATVMTKEEFKKAQQEDVMKEWEELINE